MLRITKDRKRKYSALGISVDPIHWDFVKNQPKPNCPDRELILQVIATQTSLYRSKVLELKAENKEFTASTLSQRVASRVKPRTVGEFFQAHIDRLRTEKRTGYALSNQEVYNSLAKFSNGLNICFSDIDTSWLKRYETWLREQNLSENTIGRRFRTLRAVYNAAIDERIVKSEHYPFGSYKVSKLHNPTAKRSISKEEIQRIIAYKSDCPYRKLAVDLFAFSFYTGGINFVDMAYLKRDNVVDHRIVYHRKKTGRLIRLPLQTQAKEIIEAYASKSGYLFPILSAYHKTEQSQRNRIHKVITKVNRELKAIGEELNLPIGLTTYVARHSFATVLKRSGISTSIICESLGHSSEKVTQIYLDSFENAQIDEAMKHLL